MGEGNGVASVILFTFTSEPCPHAHFYLPPCSHSLCEAPTPLLTKLKLKLWLACSRELMSCVGRLCKDYLYLYNSTTQRQLSATNPNSTTHNCNEHRRGCLLPSPIIISLAVTSVTAVNVSYDGVTCDRWGAQTAIVLFNYHIPQCWWM